MRQQESIPVPRGWTDGAAWKGAGASLLLHLFVGAALIVALSGPPKVAPQVIDLTLLPPAEIGRRPVPPVFAAAEPARPPGTAVLQVPPALAAVANPPAGPAQANTSESPHALAAAPVPPGKSPVTAAVMSPPGTSSAAISAAATSSAATSSAATSGVATSGVAPLAGDFAWIRDAIQGAISYPATARRMGWEGKVVVAFRLLSDGSVRDARVVQSSGHAALDRGAIDAVRNASPFPRSPIEAEVITPVVYRLTSR